MLKKIQLIFFLGLLVFGLYFFLSLILEQPFFGAKLQKKGFANWLIKTSRGPNKTEPPSFNILFYGDIPKFNPIHPDGVYVWQLQALVWDRLIEIDEKKIWHPSLAHSWAFNKNKTRIKLKLNPRITWSDGRPLSPQDILFSLNFYKIKNLKGALFQPILERVETFELKNNQLILKLKDKSDSNPTYATELYWSEILSSLRLLPYNLEEKPYLGTGLYKVKKFSNHKPWFLVLNEKSWRKVRAPEIKWPQRIKIKTFRSPSVLTTALKNTRGSLKESLDSVSEGDVKKSKSRTHPGTLVMGADLFNIGIDLEEVSMSAIDDKVFTKALRFNQKKVQARVRDKLRSVVMEQNDLLKLNLNDRFRDFENFNLENDPAAVKEKTSEPELEKTLPQKIVPKIFKDSELIKIEILYTNQEDSQWLSYLSEKIKTEGYMFELKLVSNAVLNELLFDRNFEAYVTDYESDNFYPLYLSLHSKGEYNIDGWSSAVIDENLEKLNHADETQNRQVFFENIQTEMHKQHFEIPIFSYKSSVLWTRNVCNPIHKQFQGLGLIYKAIICADNL